MSKPSARARLVRLLNAQGIDEDGLVDDILGELSDAGLLADDPAEGPPGTTHAKVVSGHRLTWNTTDGTFQFGGFPAMLMWVDSTLAGLWAGMREMVGPERFGLALQKQGRNSVAGDWAVIEMGTDFENGFDILVEVAAAAGWGRWQLEALDHDAHRLQVRAHGSWEALLVAGLDDTLGVHFLAGKFAGYGTRLFGTNCWTTVRRAPGSDPTAYLFEVGPSPRSLESDLDRLLESDVATRADLAVAVKRLKAEVDERSRIAAELLEAKQQAEAATRSKSRFLANMSHELRTPLHGILGSLEILADSQLDELQGQMAHGALESARSLLSIVGDLLDISKIEAGKLDIQNADFDLQRVVQASIDLLAPTAARRGLVLRAELDPELVPMRSGDAGRIRQVLLNLLSNALKFTPEGSVVLRVSGSGHGPLQIDVVDTGIGIPADRLDTVFESFRQVDDSSTRRFSGSGLGLAISRGLAERMGGSLSVDSEPGRGSIFTLRLPLPVVDGEEDTLSIRAGEVVPDHFDGRVLVVDDADVNRTIARVMLEHLGLTVVEAHNGAEALARLDDGRFDLVLMDVMMPVMDGLQATRRFRTAEADQARLPIVAMTANAMLGDREECLAAGMDDYLPKPVRGDVLRRCLARWMPSAL